MKSSMLFRSFAMMGYDMVLLFHKNIAIMCHQRLNKCAITYLAGLTRNSSKVVSRCLGRTYPTGWQHWRVMRLDWAWYSVWDIVVDVQMYFAISEWRTNITVWRNDHMLHADHFAGLVLDRVICII